MRPRIQQHGSTLLTALVMLVVLTLLVVSAIRSTNTNLRIAGNMRAEGEVLATAVQATEVVISSNFTQTPASATIGVDINQDGTTDYTANVAVPTCLSTRDLTNAENIPQECLGSAAAQNSGIFFGSSAQAAGTAWCQLQQWDVRTTVNDAATGANAATHQGVSLNVPVGTTCQ